MGSGRYKRSIEFLEVKVTYPINLNLWKYTHSLRDRLQAFFDRDEAFINSIFSSLYALLHIIICPRAPDSVFIKTLN